MNSGTALSNSYALGQPGEGEKQCRGAKQRGFKKKEQRTDSRCFPEDAKEAALVPIENGRVHRSDVRAGAYDEKDNHK